MEMERITPEITEEDIERLGKQLYREDISKSVGQLGAEIKQLENENRFIGSYIERWGNGRIRKV